LTAIFLAFFDSLTWARASSVKVPTGPRNAKVEIRDLDEKLVVTMLRLWPDQEITKT
jgi:hypothetical protein